MIVVTGQWTKMEIGRVCVGDITNTNLEPVRCAFVVKRLANREEYINDAIQRGDTYLRSSKAKDYFNFYEIEVLDIEEDI